MKPAPAARPTSSFKVLVIDDQQQMRQIIRESLYRLGIRNVVMAGNAREAMKAMRDENVDVVLSDYNLGEGTDGQQLLEAARTGNILNPTAPWIFITANSLRSDVLAAGDFTPDSYIVKPFTDQLLCRHIEMHSARKQLLAPLLHAIDARKWDEVLTVADGFIKRGDSLSVEGMKQKANALMKLGRFDDAHAAYRQALQLHSELPWALLGCAALPARRPRRARHLKPWSSRTATMRRRMTRCSTSPKNSATRTPRSPPPSRSPTWCPTRAARSASAPWRWAPAAPTSR
jgi:CheY-like chemotaxis protein